MTIRLHIHGNCQVRALAAIFAETELPFSISWCEVHRPIDAEGIAELRRNIGAADLILLQTVGPNVSPEEYRSNFVSDHARREAVVVRTAPIFFRGQHPGLFNLKADGKQLVIPGMAYVDAILLWMSLRGWSPRTIRAKLNSSGLLAPETVIGLWQDTLDELARREDTCTLQLGPYLATVGRTRQVMHSFNHPARDVIATLVRRTLDHAGLKTGPIPSTGADLLKYPHFPILPTVARALGIAQTRADLLVEWESRALTIEEYVAYCLRAFAKVPREKLMQALHETPDLPPLIAALEARHGRPKWIDALFFTSRWTRLKNG